MGGRYRLHLPYIGEKGIRGGAGHAIRGENRKQIAEDRLPFPGRERQSATTLN